MFSRPPVCWRPVPTTARCMRLPTRRLQLLCLILAWMPLVTHAGVTLHVKGLDEPLAKVVASSVQLSQYEKRDVTEAQVRHLFDNAPDQVRAALPPYGYFDAHAEGDI